MAIDHIKNYLLETAQKEAEQIIKRAEEQFYAETEAAKLSLVKKYQEMLQSEETHLREDMKRALGKLKSDCRMELLEVKNRIIDSTLELAVNRILLLPQNEYLALLRKWLARMPDNQEGELFVSTEDFKKIPRAFMDDVNEGRKTKIRLSTKTIDIIGGFILRTRNYEIDYSLNTIVKNLHAILTPKLGEMMGLLDSECK